MRTPGDDADLIAGWLFTEGVLRDLTAIVSIDRRQTGSPETRDEAVTVTLDESVAVEEVMQRWAATPTSACGLCGRVSLAHLDARPVKTDRNARWSAALVGSLPGELRATQTIFAQTGGLHAAGIFDDGGELRFVREDIGRHNAVDKVIGAALAAGVLASHCAILVVSGRAAFEIVQKAAAAHLSAVVAVGAPSDLAIQAARAAGLTLVGFARQGRFNIYSGVDRIGDDRQGADGLHSAKPL